MVAEVDFSAQWRYNNIGISKAKGSAFTACTLGNKFPAVAQRRYVIHLG